MKVKKYISRPVAIVLCVCGLLIAAVLASCANVEEPSGGTRAQIGYDAHAGRNNGESGTDPALPDGTDAVTDVLPGETDAAGTQPEPAETAETTESAETIKPIRPMPPVEDLRVGFDPALSYVEAGCLFGFLDHATSDIPSCLYLDSLAAWQNFCETLPEGNGDGDEAFIKGLDSFDQAFFDSQSLVAILTDGNSGSVCYHMGGIETAEGKLTVTLTVETPFACTKDRVRWCVLFPVGKDMAEAQVQVIYKNIREQEEDPSEKDPCPELTPRQVGQALGDMPFRALTSYTEEGILYGRTGVFDYFDAATGSMAVVRIHSVEELREAFGDPVGTQDFADEDFVAGWQGFDSTFFENRSLVVLMIQRGSGSIRHRVDSVSADSGNHSLTVQLTTEYPTVETCDMAYWFIFLPVDKQAADLDVVIRTVDLYESDMGPLMR